jgi:hypothetical protein
LCSFVRLCAPWWFIFFFSSSSLIRSFSVINLLAVCCASRTRPQKIGFQSIFYPTNCAQTEGLPYQKYAQPDNRGFFAASSAKNPQVQQAASTLSTCGYWPVTMDFTSRAQSFPVLRGDADTYPFDNDRFLDAIIHICER